MREMTHDECSELLRPYVRDELDASRREQVAAHLESCEACTEELSAVRLLGAPQVTLSAAERGTLRTGVRAGLAGGGWRHRWRRRIAPALGAAALVALTAVGIVSLTRPGEQVALETELGDAGGAGAGSGGGTTGTDGDAEDSAAATVDAAQGQGNRAEELGATQDARDRFEAGTEGVETAAGGAVGVAADRASAPTLTRERFATATFDPSALLPRRTLRPAAKRRAEALLYANIADPRVAAQVEECANVIVNGTTRPLFPSYATYYQRDRILVIGFVWVEEATNVLHYELRGWRGGGCDRPSPIYRRGRLD